MERERVRRTINKNNNNNREKRSNDTRNRERECEDLRRGMGKEKVIIIERSNQMIPETENGSVKRG
jgi:hypothetical protein